MEEKRSFTYLDSKQVEHTIQFGEGDFAFAQKDKKIFDQKIQTKPTTFFKDAMKRFAKNKSSVVGACILGVIILLTLILPVALPSDVKNTHAKEGKLAPKLFDAGTGWWDGCRSLKHVTLNVDWDLYDQSGGETVVGMPADLVEAAVVGGQDGVKIDEISYINTVNPYAHGGYLRLNLNAGSKDAMLTSWEGYEYDFRGDNAYAVTVKTIDPSASSDWVFGKVAKTYKASFVWSDPETETEYEYVLNAAAPVGGEETFTIDKAGLETVVSEVSTLPKTTKPHLVISIPSDSNETNNLVIETIKFSSNKEAEAEALSKLSVLDANKTLSMKPRDDRGNLVDYVWIAYNAKQNLYHAKLFTGSFRYDTYEVVFGDVYSTSDITVALIEDYVKRGWLTADFSYVDKIAKTPASQRAEKAEAFLASIQYTEEGRKHCPIDFGEEKPLGYRIVSGGGIVAVEIHGYITKWKMMYPERTTCPRYLFGTDANGRDLLKLTFSGLRTSLLLGVIAAVVTFAFGLVWGAIAGYFGGWTDIIMERFTDILGGVPWIVLMTLAIVRFGSSFGVFVMALCLTGWIGTASLTRTQFYRYKNREYILAARTLGASDLRLIFRHILPNAVGTIVTSSVFMITSVIYSEATIAYLNLGLRGMDSFGIVLAENQKFITTYPNLILFPSFVMLLMMISFNLFGNGLRDAFNPSLKGGE